MITFKCIKKQRGQIGVPAKYLNEANNNNEDLEIVFNSESMIVKVEDFKTVFRKGPFKVKDKFGGKDYYIYYINFMSPVLTENKLFNI